MLKKIPVPLVLLLFAAVAPLLLPAAPDPAGPSGTGSASSVRRSSGADPASSVRGSSGADPASAPASLPAAAAAASSRLDSVLPAADSLVLDSGRLVRLFPSFAALQGFRVEAAGGKPGRPGARTGREGWVRVRLPAGGLSEAQPDFRDLRLAALPAAPVDTGADASRPPAAGGAADSRADKAANPGAETAADTPSVIVADTALSPLAEADFLPFRLLVPEAPRLRWAPVEKLEVRLVEGKATEALFRIPREALGGWDALRLESPSPEFLKAARVLVSEDGEVFDTVITGAPVFRLAGGAGAAGAAEGAKAAEKLEIELPRRFGGQGAGAVVKVVLGDAESAPIPVSGVAARIRNAPAGVSAPDADTLPLKPVRKSSAPARTRYLFDAGYRNLYVSQLRVEAEPGSARRQAVLLAREEREGGSSEREVWRGFFDPDSLGSALLAVEAFLPFREFSLVFEDGDDRPLKAPRFALLAAPAHLAFRAVPGGAYALLLGDPRREPPRYGILGDTRSRDQAAKAPLRRTIAFRALDLRGPGKGPDPMAEFPRFGGPLDPAPYAYRRAVFTEGKGLQSLELDLAAFARARPDLGDIRLLAQEDGKPVQKPYVMVRSGEELSFGVELSPFSEAGGKTPPGLSRYLLRLPEPHLPLKSLVFRSPDSLFARRVRLFEAPEEGASFAARDGGGFPLLGSAFWVRFPAGRGGGSSPDNRRDGGPSGSGSAVREALEISLLAPPRGDALVLEVEEGDNAPLRLGGAEGKVGKVRLLFRTAGEGAEILYGNREATSPRYDAAFLAGEALLLRAGKAALSDVPTKQPAKELFWRGSRTMKVLFYTLLVVVVGAVLGIIARLLPEGEGHSRKKK